jgi:hypothetical protein
MVEPKAKAKKEKPEEVYGSSILEELKELLADKEVYRP